MAVQLSEQTIRRRLPAPIATAWHRVALAQENLEKTQRLCTCNEILLRMLVAFLLPDYLRGATSPKVERALRDMQPPTDGKWAQLVRELIRYLGERKDPPPFIPEACEWYFTSGRGKTDAARALDDIIRLRNKVAHEPSANETDARERMIRIHNTVRNTLLSMSWMVGYRPFRVRKSDPVRRMFEGKVQFLVGSEEQEVIAARWESNVFLSKNAVYLTNPGGTGLLELSPFMEFLVHENAREERLFLVKGFPALDEIELCHDASGTIVRKPFAEGGLTFEQWREQVQPSDFFKSLGSRNEILRGVADEVSIAVDANLGDRFERLSELGRGGMAIVYRVRDRETGTEAALKVLNADLLEEATYRERFSREAPAMQKVAHPCIVPVLDAGILPDGRPWLKMPVMAGNLQEQITEGGRPEEMVRRWAMNALEALERVHAQQIVHRDIKPSNFLLSVDGQAMLTDFGIALRRDDVRLTRTVDQVGTVQYMAPEQKTQRTVTGKADIYSLAIVLHELLTGQMPEGTIGDGIRGPFGEFIRWMGAMDARDRPTAAEALARLRTLSETPAEAPEVQRASRARSRKRTTTGGRRKSAQHRTAEELKLLAELKRIEELRIVEEKRAAEQARIEAARRLGDARELERVTAERRRKSFRTTVKAWAMGILLVLFCVNYAETAVETWLRTEYKLGIETESYLGRAAQMLEPDLGFEEQGTSNPVLYIGYSVVYFFVFPLLAVSVVAVLLWHRDSMQLMMLAVASAIDYALTLPFYLFFPVPERWTFPEANAILLSDLWRSDLIELFRPISGLNNCFPSFHVSLTVVLVCCLHRAGVRFRTASIPIGLAIILSTFVIGIHWLPDIIAGLGLGITSVGLADRLIKRGVPLRVLGLRPVAL